MMQLPEFKTWFDEQFAILLKQKIQAFNAQSSQVEVHEVANYIQILATQGKRFRPYMVYVGYTTHGGTEDIFPLLAAVELLHLFALVHDDVMDEAVARHGVATTHTAFGKQYNNARLGESLAVLEGDILMAWAYSLVYESGSKAVVQEFETLVGEVIHGQMMDTLFTVVDGQSIDSINEKMILKTARYSFYRPLMIGILAAGAGEHSRAFAETYATSLGLAFQIQDDLLDVEPESVTGKPSCTDIKMHQQTVITWYMLTKANPDQQQEFTAYFGSKDASTKDQDVLIKLLHESGAIAFAQERAQNYFDQARKAIETYQKSSEPIWMNIIQTIAMRKK